MTVAILGGGISGLTTARLLHPAHEVTVFETNDYAGGNARSIVLRDRGRDVPVDAGVCIALGVGSRLRMSSSSEWKTMVWCAVEDS